MLEKKKITNYYAKEKPALLQINKNIEEILGALKDEIDVDNINLIPHPNEALVACWDSKDVVKSKIKQLNASEVLTVDIELFKQERFYAYGTVKGNSLLNSSLYDVVKKDSLGFQPLLSLFKEEVDEYKYMKYLMVKDCIFSISPNPDLKNNSGFIEGILLSHIRLYHIETKRLVDDFYVKANSSPTVQINDGDVGAAGLLDDLAQNLDKNIDIALYDK